MFLSHAYDHRVVDGALGGMFVRRVADYLEDFDVNREIWGIDSTIKPIYNLISNTNKIYLHRL